MRECKIGEWKMKKIILLVILLTTLMLGATGCARSLVAREEEEKEAMLEYMYDKYGVEFQVDWSAIKMTTETYIFNCSLKGTTDENEKGQITASLPEGIYKVIEVEALEEYKLEEDISKRSYTFGIGRSKPAKYETSEEFEDMFYGYGAIDYTIVIPAENGGYIKMGSSSKRVNIPADNTQEKIIHTAKAKLKNFFIKTSPKVQIL